MFTKKSISCKKDISLLMSRKSLPNQHARLLSKETSDKKLQSFWLKLAVKNAKIVRGNESLVNYEKNN